MAGLALFTVTAFVNIIGPMTTDAVDRRKPESLFRMTGLAVENRMLPGQREPRSLVIETHVEPVARRVAIAAHDSKLAIMDVILVMTGKASGLGDAKRIALYVTRFAIGGRMRPE